MKALSVKQPWAGWIADRSKTLEVRNKPTKHRGQLLICASKIPDWSAITHEGAARLPLGKALCIVDLTDCRPMTNDDMVGACTAYFKGRWVYVLERVLLIRSPFLVKGQLGFFDVQIPNGMTLEAK